MKLIRNQIFNSCRLILQTLSCSDIKTHNKKTVHYIFSSRSGNCCLLPFFISKLKSEQEGNHHSRRNICIGRKSYHSIYSECCVDMWRTKGNKTKNNSWQNEEESLIIKEILVGVNMSTLLKFATKQCSMGNFNKSQICARTKPSMRKRMAKICPKIIFHVNILDSS